MLTYQYTGVRYYCYVCWVFFVRSVLAHGTCAVKETKIPMTSLVFGNFYFDYYSYRFGLGFGLGLELGLGLRLVLWVRLFSLIYEMSARTERAPSLFLFC